MSDAPPGGASPIAPHSSTPQELIDRLEAERSGAAHLVYRDAAGGQVIWPLPAGREPVTIGRRDECDVSLGWDPEVSRVHAELELIGRDWTVVDGGISRNGSYVNTVRLQGRHRLRNGDVLAVGQTTIVFRSPGISFDRTRPAAGIVVRASVTTTDRLVLIALCRPLKDPMHALPASNQAIADELHKSLPAIKKRMGAMFERFGLEHLPQTEKRTQLAAAALQSGIVTARDL
jgi:pSer/pThr/pTyr-binding forkhead associated (FHA) protein